MSKLNIGDKTPLFNALLLTKGQEFPLSNNELKGWTVIYFYPKDMTPGCTVQACEFRDKNDFFVKNNVTLYGVSNDPIKKHQKFIETHKLPFDLISDENHSMSEAFDVYKEKSMFGKKYMGIERTTFLINPDGEIAFKWEKVKPLGHTKEVMKKLQELL